MRQLGVLGEVLNSDESSIDSNNKDGNIESSTSSEESATTVSKDTTFTVTEKGHDTTPHGYLMLTETDKSVTVPKNQKSIDSVHAATKAKNNQEEKFVEELLSR